MPIKKIKISELPLVESLKGLYTIGYKIIDGIKTSVKVSLEDIQTAYQDVVNAIKKSEEAVKNANNAATTANEKAVLADTAAANANDTAEHPTYIGQDHYVYKWNKTAQAYDKTDIYTKGDAFSIKKVYASVANMEADKSNPDITEGDFVLVNTGDVEDPDNAKLYVKADGDFEFLVDMSGAIGFTGKTPQFSIGTISTLEAGSTATATISEDGVDSDGNPKYKINFAIPRGNPGAPFRVAGEYATLEALKSAVPDGSAVDGFMAVGTEAPYDYYAWVNGDWVNQGKIAGGGSGNVVVIPAATTNLSDQSTSEEIFEAFGGKQSLIDIIKEIKSTEDCIVVASDNNINSASKIVYSTVSVVYTDDNNMALSLIAWTVNITAQMVIKIVNGVASCALNTTPLMTEAPSDGNVYGRKNKGWVEVLEKSKTVEYKYDLREADLDTFKGSGGDIAFIGIQRNNKFATPENHYPVVEAGILIVAGTITKKTNQIYHTYNSNRIFIRSATSSGENGNFSDWVELAKVTDVLTKDNTTAYTPTRNYHPATKKYADASSLYKVYNLGLNVADKTGVLLLWEAEKDEYNATVYRGIMMGSFCTIPLNGITQAGTIPLVSMSASFRKVGDNNETVFMYARGSSNIRVAPATVIYNNKDYTALQVEVNGEVDIMNFVGYFDRPPLLTWVPYREETGSGEVILNEEINNNIDVFATKEFVYSSYVDTAIYGKIINADSGTISNDLIANGTNLTGVDAEERVNRYFGNLANFRNVVQDIVENHTRYFIHNSNDCRELGCLNVWKNMGNTEHELHFILTGFGNGNLHTKRYSIRITENTDDARFIIENIVSSDNLKTVTKKSTEQYAAITNKDANTVYCVTD